MKVVRKNLRHGNRLPSTTHTNTHTLRVSQVVDGGQKKGEKTPKNPLAKVTHCKVIKSTEWQCKKKKNENENYFE